MDEENAIAEVLSTPGLSPSLHAWSVLILVINQWGYYYYPSFTDEDTRTPRDYLLKVCCLAKEKQALDLNPGMSDFKTNTPGTKLEIQVWSSIPWNTINIFSICQHSGWHSWQSPAWETLHNCWSPSSKYLPSLRFGSKFSRYLTVQSLIPKSSIPPRATIMY